MNDTNNDEKVLGWDDPIQNDEQGAFEVAPAGVYAFEIVNLSRERHRATTDGKLPDCPKAVVTARIYTPDGAQVDVKYNLFLHSRCEGMLCAFFRAIGHRKHGEALRPDWTRVIGTRGRCKVCVREWQGNDGKTHQGNEIKAFLDPPEEGF
jgi:hypothetical protein